MKRKERESVKNKTLPLCTKHDCKLIDRSCPCLTTSFSVIGNSFEIESFVTVDIYTDENDFFSVFRLYTYYLHVVAAIPRVTSFLPLRFDPHTKLTRTRI